jgi:hypothetical protein
MKTTILLVFCAVTTCFSQHRPKRALPNNYSFNFRYYQEYSDFDTVSFQPKGKARRTFNNKGSIYHNPSKSTMRFKLSGEDARDSEIYNIFKECGKDKAETIGGNLYIRYQDPERGPSVAIYLRDKNKWIVYRERPAPKKV